jgi:hypothetical protein
VKFSAVAPVAAAFALGGLLQGSVACAAVSRDGFTAVRVDTPLTLDAKFADPRWASAFSDDGFTDLGQRGPAPTRTTVAVFYDDANLYVGFKLQQTVALVASQRTDNVGFGSDDFVGIAVDPAGNGEHAFMFETTPLGTRYQQSEETSRFTPVWYTQAVPTQDGWNAMLIVPLGVLKIPSNGAQHWKVNFVRATVGSNEHDSWAWSPLMADGTVPQNWPTFADARYWKPLAGVNLQHAAEVPHPRAEVYGLGSGGGGREQFVDPVGNAITRTPRLTGIDLAYPITPSISAVAAVDPDFSNVEIDQQTIAPQQLQRNLTEYRPFFAQGANYIDSNRDGFQWNLPLDRLFYSPGLGVLNSGIKVEGTSGIRSIGVLEARGDDGPDGGKFDDVAWGLLHRRESNTLALWANGVMAHHTTGFDNSYEIGGYGRSKASGLVYAAQFGQENGSFVSKVSDAQQVRAFIDIQRGGPNFGFEGALSYNDIGPQFHPVDGFTNLADIRGPNIFFDWVRTMGPGSSLKNFDLFFNADRWVDRSGNVHAADADYFLNFRTKHAQRYTLGDSVGELRDYNGSVYSGFPNGYANAVEQPFVLKDLEAHFGEGEPRSLNLAYQFGPFGSFNLNEYVTGAGFALGGGRTFSVDYDGTRERPFVGGPSDNQWLRRFAYAMPFGPQGTFTVSYRDISGTGGFALPGHNFALGIDKKFSNQSELFVNFGTPASQKTIDRFLVKYLIRLNGGI